MTKVILMRRMGIRQVRGRKGSQKDISGTVNRGHKALEVPGGCWVLGKHSDDWEFHGGTKDFAYLGTDLFSVSGGCWLPHSENNFTLQMRSSKGKVRRKYLLPSGVLGGCMNAVLGLRGRSGKPGDDALSQSSRLACEDLAAWPVLCGPGVTAPCPLWCHLKAKFGKMGLVCLLNMTTEMKETSVTGTKEKGLRCGLLLPTTGGVKGSWALLWRVRPWEGHPVPASPRYCLT